MNTIPHSAWEEMLAAVSKNTNQVKLIEMLRTAGEPIPQRELPFADLGKNSGASQDQINCIFRRAKLPYRMRGYSFRRMVRISIRKLPDAKPIVSRRGAHRKAQLLGTDGDYEWTMSHYHFWRLNSIDPQQPSTRTAR